MLGPCLPTPFLLIVLGGMITKTNQMHPSYFGCNAPLVRTTVNQIKVNCGCKIKQLW